MPRGTDFNSITSPLEESMGMVAQHMLRAPQLRYRLDQERRKIDNDTMVRRAQAGNYEAGAEAHRQTARKASSEADSLEIKNASMKWLDANDQTFSGLVDAGSVTPEAMSAYAHHYAVATGKSFDDTVKGLTALAQARKAALGASPREVGVMTGTGATSIANNEANIAAKVPTVAPGAMYRINGEWKTNPSAAAQREAEYETTTTDYPEIPAQEAVPGKPAKSRWFGSDTPEIPGKPAVPGQPARKVTTRRKLGDFNQITDPASSATPAATPATQDFVQPQDPDDSDTPENRAAAASPQNKVDALIREAQKAIQMGADPAAVIKRAKEQHGVTLTFK